MHEIANWRLANQRIATPTGQTPLDVVRWLTAMQAQDYRGTLWSIGLRMADGTMAQVERAIADRSIVRTWPLRRTLHFVAAEDVRWILALLSRRMLTSAVGRLRQLEVDAASLTRCRKAVIRALSGDRQLSRTAIYDVLTRARVMPTGQRGVHILWQLAVEGILCFAAPAGTQQTYALLDEWVPTSRILGRDDALAELARRYFQSHGPATVYDFAWWSGLTVADAKTGAAMIAPDFVQETINRRVYVIPRNQSSAPPGLHLLSGFDEFLLAYKDRSASLDPAHTRQVVPGNNGMFMPTIVVNGQVAGVWKPSTITATPFRPLTQREARAFRAAARRYVRFTTSPPPDP
jgi:Winged helix DNA-binding domain